MDPVHDRGSMDPVQSRGPWTPGPCFVLTPLMSGQVDRKCVVYIFSLQFHFGRWNNAQSAFRIGK